MLMAVIFDVISIHLLINFSFLLNGHLGLKIKLLKDIQCLITSSCMRDIQIKKKQLESKVSASKNL
jgi:hypothetical protein